MSFTVHPVPGFGAEDVLVHLDGPHEGSVVTGVADGSLLRLSHDGRRIERIARTGGRPLGLDWHPDGRVVVCDSDLGLLAVDPETGLVETLATEAEGVPLTVCNNPAVREDGTIWFTDSSQTYRLEHWRRDFSEDTRTGRLLQRDPDGSVRVLADGLRFANGVSLAADGSFVSVAESRGACLRRHWLTGPRAGTTEQWVDLPGYPDNTARGTDGLLWVAIGSERDPLVDVIGRLPRAARRAVMRLPQRLQPQPRGVHAQAYDDTGALVRDCVVDADTFHMVTGVREHDGRLWMGSVEEGAVAVLDL